RAHFDSHVARGGTHLERRSAGARNRGAVVFGMNPLLHPGSPLRRESDGPSSGANIQAIIPHRHGGKASRRPPAPSPMLKYWRLRHKSSTPRRGGCTQRARAFRWVTALLFVLLPASVVFAQPAPVRGGHLVVVQSAEPPILDPSATTATAATAIVHHNVLEGLVKITSSGAIVPALAESWTISPDAMEYVFH